jgi:hypothetical protein
LTESWGLEPDGRSARTSRITATSATADSVCLINR